ncbi:MAG: nitrogenase iron-molybdenum cofactor biosynthesis protein NifE [Denitrovibrio sp.]|nr:MAG: nitrogenase iron-molybdenum cofactor biosynthesis protein NifE [Denitrovibrio sp.]
MKLTLQTLVNEPGCDHNQSKTEEEKKKACKKPTPGATAGGCAFDGAQIVLLPVADAAHLIHGPITCCGHSYNNRGTRSHVGDMHTYGFTTDISEMDIIFGSEDKLKESIKYIAEKFKPKAVFVYSTCVTAMIGEDIGKVCEEASSEVRLPVIPVDSPGFSGSKNLGNKFAGHSLVQHVIGTKEPKHIPEFSINMIGEYNIAGELWQIEPLFKELGITLLSKMTGNAEYDELCYAHKAKVSVVICSQALISLARQLKDKYEIPYLEGSFYGMKQTKTTLLDIAKALGSEFLVEKVNKLTDKMEKETYERLAPYLPKLKGKKVLVYTGGVKSWSVLNQLQELGMEVIKSSTRKSTDEDIERILDHFEGNEEGLMPKGDGRTILNLLKEHNADLLLAGGRNMYNAMKGQVPFLDVNQERLFAYAGYDGMVELSKNMVYTMESPVFDIAHSKAPWEEM